MRLRLKVWPIANADGTRRELARFYVESESGKPPYVVDLLSMKCNGCCNCEDFIHRIMNKVAKLFSIPWQFRPIFRCKHLNDAREYFTQECLNILQAKEDQYKDANIVIGSPDTKNYE